MDNFEMAVEKVLQEEVGYEQYKKGQSGYTNDPHDHGSETKWGISKKYNPDVDIKNLSKEDAKRIYRNKYWDVFQGDKIADYGLALLFFDSVVNPGPGRAIKWMQASMNLLNNKGPQLEVDGKFGNKSLTTMNGLIKEGYGDALAILFIGMKAAWHIDEVAHDTNDARFFRGWMRRMSRIAKEVFK